MDLQMPLKDSILKGYNKLSLLVSKAWLLGGAGSGGSMVLGTKRYILYRWFPSHMNSSPGERSEANSRFQRNIYWTVFVVCILSNICWKHFVSHKQQKTLFYLYDSDESHVLFALFILCVEPIG